jgi:hypothetical protein
VHVRQALDYLSPSKPIIILSLILTVFALVLVSLPHFPSSNELGPLFLSHISSILRVVNECVGEGSQCWVGMDEGTQVLCVPHGSNHPFCITPCLGESVSVIKHTDPVPDPRAVNQDKKNMLFSVSTSNVCF